MPLDNSKFTILLVISSLEHTEDLINTLLSAGFHIYKTENISSAIPVIENESPDLILSDMDKALPQEAMALSGLKNRGTGCFVPVLFLTSPTNESYISGDFIHDHVDFILKPFPPQELIIRIQHQLLWLKAVRTIRRQNKSLRATLKARDKLYAVIAHDLRSPISTIKMINSSLSSEKARIKDPKILKLFEMINDTTEEAFNLLENLLQWTRNQNGKTKVYTTSFNMTPVIRQVCLLFSAIALEKEIVLTNLVKGTHQVCADIDMVKTILRNLISNAIKFTYPGGRVEVEIADMPDHALISIKDTGKGIPRSMHPHLLNSNTYPSSYGPRNEKGSGLGLILSRDFVRINKGKLWFLSQEGVGTTFYFTLPTCNAEVSSNTKR